jgi:hypothetical protein
MIDPTKRIEELCSEAGSTTDPSRIEPLVDEFRVALHEEVKLREKWMQLCERAAREQDPGKLLELVTEINRLFALRGKLPPAKELNTLDNRRDGSNPKLENSPDS